MVREIDIATLVKKYGLLIHPSDLIGHEDNVGEKIFLPILSAFGYDTKKDVDRKPRVKHVIISKSGLEPDYGIYKYTVTKDKSPEYVMVADVKRYGTALTDKMVEKIAGYCGLAGSMYGVLTNGITMYVIKPTRGVVEWEYLDYFPSKNQLIKQLEKEKIEYNPNDITYAKRITTVLTEKEIEEIAGKCHDIIRSRKGMAVPDRLFEFSKLIVARIVDERRYKEGEQKELLITSENIESMKGKKQTIKSYIKNILNTIRDEIGIFQKGESVDLEDDIIEEIIDYLDEYPLWSEKMDVLGHVYEKFLMNTMTGRELGGYFTPRPIVNLIVKMVNPTMGDKILDPACGSGGFLISSLIYMKEKHNLSSRDGIKKIARHIYGIDIFNIIVKLSQINLWLHGDCHDNVFRADSLEFTDNSPKILVNALKNPIENGFDLILTNPPFGAKEGNKLTVSRLEKINSKWKKLGINLFECAYGQKGNITLQPQVPFIELCIKCLKEPSKPGTGGRLGIVIDNGVLSNIVEEAPIIREIIRKYCVVEGIVGLPNGTFKAYGSHVYPAFLVLRRKHEDEQQSVIFRGEPRKIGLIPARTRYLPDSEVDLETVYEKWMEWEKEQPLTLKIYDKRLPIWSLSVDDALRDRIDNNYYSPASIEALDKLKKIEKEKICKLEELDVIIDNIVSGTKPSEEGDVPLIEGSNVFPNYIFPDLKKFGIFDEDLILEENDILIVKDGSPSAVSPITKILLDSFPKLMPTYHVYRIRLNKDYKYFAKTISSFLNTKIGQAILRKYISGGVSTTIRDEELKKVVIPIPIKPNEIKEIDKRIEKLQESVMSVDNFLYPSKAVSEFFKINEKDMTALPISYMPGARRDKQGYYKEFEK